MGPKTPPDPRALKRKVSPQILRLPGVSGIGVPKGQLTVYLEADSEDIRERVREVLKTVSPEAEVVFLVTGKFSKQDLDWQLPSADAQEKGIAETFDDLAHDRCCKYKSNGLTASSQVLLDFISKEGLPGKTVLEIGCGTGFFALETLRNGASSCVGVDLSSAAIQEANAFAKESGLEDRARFEVANAASAHQPAFDIVVMDKVLCCYPDADALLKTASESSKELVGFVVPRDEGLMKPCMRIGTALINLVEKLRRSGFRLYLHPLRTIDRLLAESGFQQADKAKSRFWLVFLYNRSGPALPGQG